MKHRHTIGQKRTNINHIPFEKRAEMKSITDIKNHFDGEMKEAIRSLFDTEAAFHSFMKDRKKDHKVMKKHYWRRKQEMLSDSMVLSYFTKKTADASYGFGIHSGYDVVSSYNLKGKYPLAYFVRRYVHNILKKLHPVACDGMLKHCGELFQNGALLTVFGGVVLHENNKPLFVPPVLMVFHEMSMALSNKTEMPRFIDHMIYRHVGQLLCGHMNMRYHLANAVSLEEKKEQFEKLMKLQDTVEEITCSLRDPRIARENNLFYRKEGIALALTPQERLETIQKFLLSELIVDCHRNDGNIKE